jgi:NAD(P)-dependent dehydrogenase (short-subunit alcohol dehydrogenase family)
MILENKTAVIYGAGGAVGGAVARAFAPEGGQFWEQWQEMLANTTHARRVMTLEEMANMAVFMASDKASGITGTTVNLSMGSLDD